MIKKQRRLLYAAGGIAATAVITALSLYKHDQEEAAFLPRRDQQKASTTAVTPIKKEEQPAFLSKEKNSMPASQESLPPTTSSLEYLFQREKEVSAEEKRAYDKVWSIFYHTPAYEAYSARGYRNLVEKVSEFAQTKTLEEIMDILESETHSIEFAEEKRNVERLLQELQDYVNQENKPKITVAEYFKAIGRNTEIKENDIWTVLWHFDGMSKVWEAYQNQSFLEVCVTDFEKLKEKEVIVPDASLKTTLLTMIRAHARENRCRDYTAEEVNDLVYHATLYDTYPNLRSEQRAEMNKITARHIPDPQKEMLRRLRGGGHKNLGDLLLFYAIKNKK